MSGRAVPFATSLLLAAGSVALALGLLSPATARAADAPPLLHAIFQDHAVLQRDRPIRLWGQAGAGERVRVSLAGVAAATEASGDGRWMLELPALPAGGPHELRVDAGGRRQVVHDVLVGDVWLCSGQSNMELQVWRTLDARAEIDGAGNDRIRLFTVPQVAAVAPAGTFGGPVAWAAVTPDSIREFSAACYYFARELQKTVDVPMGLVDASWGGSRIQAWMSEAALARVRGYDDALAVLARYRDDPVAAAADWGEVWQRWWSARPGVASDDRPWRGDADAGRWAAAPPGLGAWERWGVPALAAFDGMLWYRTQVRLTAAQAAQPATLELGAADEIDVTWVNGRGVGSEYAPGSARAYPLPPGLLHEGDNAVVVNVLDTWRDGGLAGPASAHALRFADGTRVPLDPHWRYRVVPADVGTPPRAPWQSASGLSTLHDGMIAPLGRFGFRGALWYQGESNTFEHAAYAGLLQALRADWRERFDAGLPMLVVELAGFGMPATHPGESDWAALREAQRRVADGDAATGLAVAIDIGDAYDIHPPNKQELGRRLARVARHVVYGEAIAPSGPVPARAMRDGDAVVVAFDGVASGLVARGADGPIGFELCGDGPDSCRYATATLDGAGVRLQVPGLEATRVRYCWGDGPVCTLFDADGLPAGPFEIPLPGRGGEGTP